MTTAKQTLQSYNKFLLNRLTAASLQLTDVIETYLYEENGESMNVYHKIMVHGWQRESDYLFGVISDHYGRPYIPVNYEENISFCSFYTDDIRLVFNIIKSDFMFPYKRSMFSIDVILNDKTSNILFDSSKSLDDIISGIVCRRFTHDMELDLSNFCTDEELISNKINFFKLSLLCNFKELMIRMGRDTKVLNLSNNNLSMIPHDILSFFIKSTVLIGINLSNNNLKSVAELVRVTSQLEKLWLEENPLCADVDPMEYVKVVTTRFPLLTELDGVKINQNGILYPIWRNFIGCNDRMTKMVVEKFLTLYFSHYDSPSRQKVDAFYHETPVFSISSNFTESEGQFLPHYEQYTRNAITLSKRKFLFNGQRTFRTKLAVSALLTSLPDTVHNPSTFTVDVMKLGTRDVMVIVDGIYKEINQKGLPERFFQFRRTFIFESISIDKNILYQIKHELFSLSFASKENVQHYFKAPIRNVNSLCLINPDPDDIYGITKVFQHLTQLKPREIHKRLMVNKWDIKEALQVFCDDLRKDNIPADRFITDDLSDLSSCSDID